ncbi:MAG TPA: hypothetical protein VKV28_05640 [Candidatus Binataceae bacterium]|nr:hypothetical protein [Candidatus Binataceae bacterium]
MKIPARWMAVGLLLSLAPATVCRASDVQSFLAAPTEIKVYDPSGTRVTGHGHYNFARHGVQILLDGEISYLDGSRDLEHAVIAQPPNSKPMLRHFEADFFSPHGKLQLVEKANFSSGKASCLWSNRWRTGDYRAQLHFPGDASAGALAVLPLEQAFSHGERSTKLHLFECAPRPEIIDVDAKLTPKNQARFAPGAAQLELLPDLGWLTALAGPFLPKASVWLNPHADWGYVGTLKERYYRGRRELLVRQPANRQGS